MRFVKLHRQFSSDEGAYSAVHLYQNVDAIKRFSRHSEADHTVVTTTDGYDLRVRETPDEILKMIERKGRDESAKANLREALWDEILNYARYAKCCDDNGRADAGSIINQIIDQLEHDHA